MSTTQELAAELERHRGLVLGTARHYAQRCREPVEDLIQEGWIGFLRASERFQPGPDRSLGAYAKPFVRGAILRHLRGQQSAGALASLRSGSVGAAQQA